MYNMYLFLSLSLSMCMYIYIYIERERYRLDDPYMPRCHTPFGHVASSSRTSGLSFGYVAIIAGRHIIMDLYIS